MREPAVLILERRPFVPCKRAVGFLSNPIRGTVEVTDREITIDVDLGLIKNLESRQSPRVPGFP